VTHAELAPSAGRPRLEARDRVEGLLTVLGAEERLYLELRDLLQRERELIANLDVAGLEQGVRQKESLAEEGRLLEESRLELAALLARELGIGSERATLSQLCAALGPERDAALRGAHSRLTALVGAVQELVAANSGFAGEAEGRVRATLQLLGRLLPDQPTYQPPGAREAAPAAGRLLRRTA
jgi:hypothetical protein